MEKIKQRIVPCLNSPNLVGSAELGRKSEIKTLFLKKASSLIKIEFRIKETPHMQIIF